MTGCSVHLILKQDDEVLTIDDGRRERVHFGPTALRLARIFLERRCVLRTHSDACLDCFS